MSIWQLIKQKFNRAVYISGIDPENSKQVGLAKKLVQDVFDFNKRR